MFWESSLTLLNFLASSRALIQYCRVTSAVVCPAGAMLAFHSSPLNLRWYSLSTYTGYRLKNLAQQNLTHYFRFQNPPLDLGVS